MKKPSASHKTHTLWTKPIQCSGFKNRTTHIQLCSLLDMAHSNSVSNLLFALIVLFLSCEGSEAATFTFVNKCDYTVWPGILAGAGTPPLESTGFELAKKDSRTFQAPPGWSGRFWARTGCNFDSSGHGSCATGDCGSDEVECNGAGAAPPATLAEFTLGKGGSDDFYDVSLVDGYNLPLIVEGSTGNGGGSCTTTGCIADLNRRCPAELRVGDGEACKSACEAFGTAEYCCSGEYGSPATCKPTAYSAVFKSACPKSYSYAYDDASSTFTCSGADYTITFCPNFSSVKSKTDSLPKALDGTAETLLGGKGSWLANLALGDSIKPQPSLALHIMMILVMAAISISPQSLSLS